MMRRSDGFQSARRGKVQQWVAVLALGGIPLELGCATLRPGDDCAADGGSCLQNAAAAEPPKASLVQTYRCVDEFPCEAVASPPGTYVNAWGQAMQQQAAIQADIISRNLWFDGGQQLGPDGQERMVMIAESFAAHPRWVVIEEEPVAIAAGQSYDAALAANARLNAQRKAAVIDALSRLGIADAAELVFFTSDRGVGTRGIEAPDVFNRQFSGGVGGRGRSGGLGGQIGGGGLGGGIGGGGIGGGGIGGGGIF